VQDLLPDLASTDLMGLTQDSGGNFEIRRKTGGPKPRIRIFQSKEYDKLVVARQCAMLLFV
jgi:hypothetical protein